MDYKEFISNIFGSIKVSKESDNEFIIILPTASQALPNVRILQARS